MMTSHHDVQAVSFDVGGTLLQPWPSVGAIYAMIAARHGFTNLSEDTLTTQFLQSWMTSKKFDYSRAQWSQLVDATFDGLIPVRPSESFFEELYSQFAEPAAWRLYDDVLPALKQLKAHGLKLAVVSNWDERLRPLLSALRLAEFFQEVVISCEVGYTKPHRRIYEQLLQKLRLPGESVLHVGDSWEMDVAGARGAGLQAVWLSRSVPPGPDQIASLSSLSM